MVESPVDVATLLELRTWTAFDVDETGRVLAGHDETGSIQLVEVDPDGTRRPLTALPGACSGRYLPGRRSGRRTVVVEHDTDGDERAQLSLLHPAEVHKPVGLDDLEPLVRDPDHISTLVDVGPGWVAYATNRRDGVDFDVVVRDLSTGVERVLYDGGGYTFETAVREDAAVVTVLSLQPCSTQVRLVRPDAVRDVTPADEHALHTGAHLLADGSVVMASNSGRELTAIVRVDPDGTWTTLVEDDAYDLSCEVSPDGTALLVSANVDGADRLSLHDLDGTRLHDVALPATGVVTARWSADSRLAVLGLVAPRTPGDVLLLDAATGAVRPVVSAADAAPAGLLDRLVEPTVHVAPARDGERIPCFAYAPPEPTGSVVIHVHGGPEAQARRLFNPVIQAFVAAGHTVLVPNVRGSTGYGKRWYSLDDGRLRLESVADLADLRAWVPTLGGDPQRAALYGGSYGGYMVLAGLSMQPQLWAAGVDVVGISSLVTFLENTSDYRRAVREREYGSLEHDRDFLERASPLTYLGDIASPLLVIHGANDPRVPLSESEQIEAALRAKGVPCELLVYADEGHGLAKRANRLDAYVAAVAFLGRHLA